MTSKNTEQFRIQVVNTQTIDGRREAVTENASGTFRISGCKAYITYKTGASTNMLKVDGDVITLKRTGEYGSDMRFEAGKRSEFMYRTPYGSIPMTLFTSNASHTLSPAGGIIRLDYVLDTNGDKLYNNMIITIER